MRLLSLRWRGPAVYVTIHRRTTSHDDTDFLRGHGQLVKAFVHIQETMSYTMLNLLP